MGKISSSDLWVRIDIAVEEGHRVERGGPSLRGQRQHTCPGCTADIRDRFRGSRAARAAARRGETGTVRRAPGSLGGTGRRHHPARSWRPSVPPSMGVWLLPLRCRSS